MATFTATYQIAPGDTKGTTIQDTITLEQEKMIDTSYTLIGWLEQFYDGCLIINYWIEDEQASLQRDLWEKSGRVQYNEYRNFMGSSRITNQQARAEAERTATQFRRSPEKTAGYEGFVNGFLAEHAQRVINRIVNEYLVDGKTYPEPLPDALKRWYCYTSDGGHCILCAIESLYVPDGEPGNFLVPVPVKSVRRGYRMEKDSILVDLPYDSQVGLVTPEEDDEF